jgi:hypothetical protein
MSNDGNDFECEEELESYQIDIYNGLKIIREDIADFYLEGLELIKNKKSKARSHFIAHAAREIDGGLRDILSPDKEKNITQEKLNNDKLGNYEEYKDVKGHVSSILTSLNSNLESEIAKEWIDIATKFARLAHRDSKNRRLRDISEVEI